jgi:hypothetical protein
MSESNPPLLTKADLPEIIQRYRSGESMLTIAKNSRVQSRQLYNWVMAEAGEEYAAIQTECFLNRIADADEMLLFAQDAVQVTRAREIARFARMDLERRRPHLYGQKQEMNVNNAITVIVQRGGPTTSGSEANVLETHNYQQVGSSPQDVESTKE